MTRKIWIKYKKNFPGNWAQIVSERLKIKGVICSARKVSQVRIGNIADPNLQESVWIEIRILKQEMKEVSEKLQKLKAV